MRIVDIRHKRVPMSSTVKNARAGRFDLTTA